MILVTGGTGLLGATLLLELLQNGEDLRAIYRNEKSIEKTRLYFQSMQAEHLFLKIHWFKADITDIPLLEKAFIDVKTVYHCAALVSFDPKDEMTLRKVNIEGTANLVNLAIDYRVEKFCYVSSIAALGEPNANSNTITENCSWNPNSNHSDYALTKYGAELEVWRGSQEGLDCIIVNPGVLFGNGIFTDGSHQIIAKVQSGMPFYTKGTIAIISAKDTSKAMIKLMNSSIVNQSFILVAHNLPYKDFLRHIASKLNKKPPTLYASPLATSIAWRIDYLISLLTTKKRSFTRPIAKASHATYIYQNAKIQKALNLEFESMEQIVNQASAQFDL